MSTTLPSLRERESELGVKRRGEVRARRVLIWGLACLGLVWGASAGAQDVAVDGFLPAPDQTGFLGFASTRTPGAWGFDANLWTGYALRPLEADSFDGGSSVPVRHRFESTAIAQLGILSRGALALRMPVVWVQRGDDVPGAPALAQVAAGNPAIDGRVRLLGAPARPDGSVNDGGALALRSVVHLPVGTNNAYFADDATRLDVSVISDLQMFGIGAGAALTYRHRFGSERVGGYDLRDELRFAGGIRLPLPLVARAYPGKVQESVLAELEVGMMLRDPAGATTPVEGRLAYRAVVSDVFLTLGLGAGMRTAIGSPDFRALLAVGWSPRVHDQDGDGIPDSRDQCVYAPEDRDGFEDGDGCPDDDNDGDLIVDEDDRCPNEPAEIGRDEDEDGCTDP